MRTTRQGQMLPLKSMLTLLISLALATGCKKGQVAGADAAGQLQTSAANTFPQTLAANTFIMGINGHPLNSYEYNANSSTISGVDYTTQSNMVKAMGMTYYRVDITTDSMGKSTNEAKLLDIIAKCASNNIKILPMIGDRCNYAATATTTNNYQRAYKQMQGFATKYGQYFDYFEYGNEWELFDTLYKVRPVPHLGQDSTDYDMRRVRLAEQYVRGMEAGLKSILPTKQSMVNTAGYIPTFWMDRMLAAAPTINILGWHYYADWAPLLPDRGITDLHQFLYDRYHRPIWYTETGYTSKKTLTQQQNEDNSNAWRIQMTNEANAHPNVKGVIFFQLLDRPERTTSTTNYNFGEETYGWVKFNNYPGKDDPAAYNTWRANPNRYQDWSYKKPAAELVGPDLIVTDISWAPSSPLTGNSVVFTVIVKNIGVAATPAGTILGVSFKVDGNSAGCNGSSTTSLAPGATRTLTANGCSPSSWTAVVGTHSVVAKVDDQSRIIESDETNNTRTESITVTN